MFIGFLFHTPSNEQRVVIVINSILDQDLYTFTICQGVLRFYPTAYAKFSFVDRNRTTYTSEFVARLQSEIVKFADIVVTNDELSYLSARPYFDVSFLNYIKNYRFDPNEVTVALTPNGNLTLTIQGLWHRTVFWEVPLLALVSELYFKIIDKQWNGNDQMELMKRKSQRMWDACCNYSDFGTRRRRNYETQRMVCDIMRENPFFKGTSNVALAKEFNLPPIGTMSHQWIMGISALEGLRHANRIALHKWAEVYRGQLGIALTDTFTTDAFLRDFDGYLARLYDGTRWDSGDPFVYTDKITKHYKDLGIEPESKRTVYSDSLTCDKCGEIQKYCDGKPRPQYGVGTHLTNDFAGSKPLNIVIKLRSVNGIPVVKLSDVPTKAIGEPEALRIAKHVHLGRSLDDQE